MLRTGSETKSMVVAKPRDANDEARRRSHGWTKGDGLSEAKKLKQKEAPIRMSHGTGQVSFLIQNPRYVIQGEGGGGDCRSADYLVIMLILSGKPNPTTEHTNETKGVCTTP